jgi:endonuclease/exonuclease/phosphatase (EEP) superfamily protein YafD
MATVPQENLTRVQSVPTRWTQIIRWTESLLVAMIVLTAIAPLLQIDRWRMGMLLTYPPRLLIIFPAAIGLVALLYRRQFVKVTLVAAAIGLLGFDLGFGGGPQTSQNAGQQQIIGLAFNVHDATKNVGDLAELCRDNSVQLLCLQEVKAKNRQAFIDGLPDYKLFSGNESIEYEYSRSGGFDSLIGIHRDLLTASEKIEIATGITGYRTFAVRTLIDSKPIWLVNVHTTKAFWSHGGITGLINKADYKSLRHTREFDALSDWISSRGDVPVVIAGDFNAPINSRNLRFKDFESAHRVAGSGFQLTFPAKFPVWGIDHVLGNDRVKFTSYKILKTSYSDHCAQLFEFSFANDNDR